MHGGSNPVIVGRRTPSNTLPTEGSWRSQDMVFPPIDYFMQQTCPEQRRGVSECLTHKRLIDLMICTGTPYRYIDEVDGVVLRNKLAGGSYEGSGQEKEVEMKLCSHAFPATSVARDVWGKFR
ncbi:hypothetical protein QFC21_000885 [Naganishia friedmannii]|uniref:Uncharacterized protein n=1 Tax=Naganishia friedmannii TaxID=89922 RepID=A0ACC2W8B0_9TREE|nr:hypothetical protein QFC21_000885 [Naganishia friedmannii]